MKNKKLPFVIFLLSLVFLISCKKSSWLKSAGQQVEITRQLGNFNSIALYNRINVVLIQDTVNKVTLKGGKNLLSFIKTDISGGKLVFKDENKVNWIRSFKKEITAYLHYKNINQIFYYGAGNISTQDTLRSDSISITCWDGTGSIKIDFSGDSAMTYIHTGSADVHILGKAHYSYIYCGGTGAIYLNNLTCKNVYVNNDGTGNFYVAPLQNLGYEIYSLGDVYCYTKPAIVYHTDIGQGYLIYK